MSPSFRFPFDTEIIIALGDPSKQCKMEQKVVMSRYIFASTALSHSCWVKIRWIFYGILLQINSNALPMLFCRERSVRALFNIILDMRECQETMLLCQGVHAKRRAFCVKTATCNLSSRPQVF